MRRGIQRRVRTTPLATRKKKKEKEKEEEKEEKSYRKCRDFRSSWLVWEQVHCSCSLQVSCVHMHQCGTTEETVVVVVVVVVVVTMLLKLQLLLLLLHSTLSCLVLRH